MLFALLDTDKGHATLELAYTVTFGDGDARHNNTIGDFEQQPDIANGMGTMVLALAQKPCHSCTSGTRTAAPMGATEASC